MSFCFRDEHHHSFLMLEVDMGYPGGVPQGVKLWAKREDEDVGREDLTDAEIRSLGFGNDGDDNEE